MDDYYEYDDEYEKSYILSFKWAKNIGGRFFRHKEKLNSTEIIIRAFRNNNISSSYSGWLRKSSEKFILWFLIFTFYENAEKFCFYIENELFKKFLKLKKRT